MLDAGARNAHNRAAPGELQRNGYIRAAQTQFSSLLASDNDIYEADYRVRMRSSE
jgi:hypothetical protein